MQNSSYIVGEQDSGKRFDIALSAAFSELSRSALVRLITNGDALLNGAVAQKRTLVLSGDIISVVLPKIIQNTATPENIPLDVVFEDLDIIVVNKPKGMVVHPAAGNPDGTLVNALLHHCKGSLSGIGGVMRPGIVHRIDKDTSGLLVAAKNDLAHNNLCTQLATHCVERCYHAVAKGVFAETAGSILRSIARDKHNRLRMAVDDNGKPATTHYSVLKQYKSYCYIKLLLETGRTHQIRVHMKNTGHPLAGDYVYGEHNNPKLLGQCLHAKSLKFTHPVNGTELFFETDLPEYFINFLDNMQ